MSYGTPKSTHRKPGDCSSNVITDRPRLVSRAQERRESAIDAALERHGISKKPVSLATLEWQRKWLSEE